MDISFFFRPPAEEVLEALQQCGPQTIGAHTQVYAEAFPDWTDADVVLLGVPEDRATLGPTGAAQAPDAIRPYLYQLAAPALNLKLADLGNLRLKGEPEDTYSSLAYVAEALLKENKTLIVLGGSGDVAYGQYLGYQNLETLVEYAAIDSRPDLIDAEVALTNQSHNSAIFIHVPNYLYHFTLLGAQIFQLTEEEKRVLRELHFDVVRVGDLHTDLSLAEPALRQAQLVALDMSAVRQADAPGTNHPSPAGLTVEELCTLARYAGMAYRCSSLVVTDVVPALDRGGQTSHLAALAVWFFLEGLQSRTYDEPAPDRSNVECYRALIPGPVPEVVFYRSERTERWWMEVPSPQALRGRGLQVLVPCTAHDYRTAQRGELPDRWWNAHYRFK